MPFWDRQIEAVIVTHPDADHFAGLIDVIKRYKVKSFYTNGEKSDSLVWGLLDDELAQKDLSAKFLHRGKAFSGNDSLRLKILWPDEDLSSKRDQIISKYDRNDTSTVILLSYGNFKALFTGDAEAPVLDPLLMEIGKVDFLKVSHHGSKDAVSDNLIQMIDPDIAVIPQAKKTDSDIRTAQPWLFWRNIR